MGITKKYIIEHIKILRNDIIDIFGVAREMLQTLEKGVRASQKIDKIDFQKNNKKINMQLSLFDQKNIEVVSNSKIDENDIRLILGGMRAVTNIEKVSTKIIRFINIFDQIDTHKYDENILRILSMIIMMFDKLVIGLIYSEIDKCYEIIKDDKEIDDLRKLYSTILLQEMMKNDNFIPKGVDLIDIMDILERIGDYIVYVAQDVIYIVTGDDIRYNPNVDLHCSRINREPI
ncbi:MAG TPA: PhoU domain-containing protein [Spirochaetota bacterium]|nr:PhoU domain-containing protein [Spirochaetota bacterium]